MRFMTFCEAMHDIYRNITTWSVCLDRLAPIARFNLSLLPSSPQILNPYWRATLDRILHIGLSRGQMGSNDRLWIPSFAVPLLLAFRHLGKDGDIAGRESAYVRLRANSRCYTITELQWV